MISKKERFKDTMANILLNKYGVESVFLNPKAKHQISLEALGDELEANSDELFASDTTTEVVENEDLAGIGPDVEEETDEYANLDKDKQFGMTDQGDYYYSDDNWENIGIDEMKSSADCVNMLKIIGNYTNDYVLNFEKILNTNPDTIDYTGDLKGTELYNAFISPSLKVLTEFFKDDSIIKHVENLVSVMTDKKKMVAITGQPNSPFLYEGFQLVLLETLKTLLALIPSTVKLNKPLPEVISTMKLKVVDALIQMVADIVEISPLYGTKIYYVAPVDSEVTGKSEEKNSTPYAKLEVFNADKETITGMKLAGESIMNLVEIKNNKALIEYSVLNKMMVVISFLCTDIDVRKSALNALELVLKISMEQDPTKIQELVEKGVELFKNEVILPQIKKMAELSTQENSKLVDEPEADDNIASGFADLNGLNNEEENVTPNYEEPDFSDLPPGEEAGKIPTSNELEDF